MGPRHTQPVKAVFTYGIEPAPRPKQSPSARKDERSHFGRASHAAAQSSAVETFWPISPSSQPVTDEL